MDSNRKQDELFLAPETGIWLVFAQRAVPGRGFDDAPLSVASLSRLGSWPWTPATARHAGQAAAARFDRVRAALKNLFHL